MTFIQFFKFILLSSSILKISYCCQNCDKNANSFNKIGSPSNSVESVGSNFENPKELDFEFESEVMAFCQNGQQPNLDEIFKCNIDQFGGGNNAMNPTSGMSYARIDENVKKPPMSPNSEKFVNQLFDSQYDNMQIDQQKLKRQQPITKIDLMLENFRSKWRQRWKLINDMIKGLEALEQNEMRKMMNAHAAINKALNKRYKQMKSAFRTGGSAIDTAILGIQISLLPFAENTAWENYELKDFNKFVFKLFERNLPSGGDEEKVVKKRRKMEESVETQMHDIINHLRWTLSTDAEINFLSAANWLCNVERCAAPPPHAAAAASGGGNPPAGRTVPRMVAFYAHFYGALYTLCARYVRTLACASHTLRAEWAAVAHFVGAMLQEVGLQVRAFKMVNRRAIYWGRRK